jgi:Mitochondrial carrier protein
MLLLLKQLCMLQEHCSRVLILAAFALWLQSGGVAGTSVDVALYPLDTIKTRLQSSQGESFALWTCVAHKLH